MVVDTSMYPAAYTTFYDYDGGNAPVYIGEALPGKNTSDPDWRIQKREYNNGRIISIKWANGQDTFNKIWSDRASYSYS